MQLRNRFRPIARIRSHLQPGLARRLDQTTQQDVELWLIVLVVMGLDILLTLYGLDRGLVEQNRIIVFGIQSYGYAMLAFLKVPAILLGIVGWLALPETLRQLNLIGLATPWLWAVMINFWMIITHLG